MKKLINFEHSEFNKYYLKDLFTNELTKCTREEFEKTVVRFRNLYEMKYDGPNRQIFLRHGIIEAARERT